MTGNRIERVLQVLTLVAFSPGPVRLKTIGEKLKLHPSMVSRIVSDLIAAGFLAKNAYRSVTGTPALALLGEQAGKNHPLSKIAAQVLRQPMDEKGISCEFSTVARGGIYRFYQVRRGTPPFEVLWRSDTAAVIFAARKTPWEQIRDELSFAAAGEDQNFSYFQERYLAALEERRLTNFHAGRYWQLTQPVDCGGIICALSVSGTASADYDKLFFECSRLAAKIRSLYESSADSNA